MRCANDAACAENHDWPSAFGTWRRGCLRCLLIALFVAFCLRVVRLLHGLSLYDWITSWFRDVRSESLCPVLIRLRPSFCSRYFKIVDSGGCRAKDVCALVVAEVCKIVAEDLPPLGVAGGYKRHGPIRADHEAIGP